MYITDCRQKCKWQKSKIRNDPWDWYSYPWRPRKQNVFDQGLQVYNFQKGPYVHHFIKNMTAEPSVEFFDKMVSKGISKNYQPVQRV